MRYRSDNIYIHKTLLRPGKVKRRKLASAAPSHAPPRDVAVAKIYGVGYDFPTPGGGGGAVAIVCVPAGDVSPSANSLTREGGSVADPEGLAGVATPPPPWAAEQN